MGKFATKLLGMFAVLMLALTAQSFADENENLALKSQVKNLNDKVNTLERLVSTLQTQNPGGSREYTGSIVPSGQEGPNGLIHTAQDIRMSGFIDTQFNQNLDSATTNLGGNPLRTYDANQNTFSVNNVELDFEKTANPEGGAGFRTDIMFGEDARIINNASTNASANERVFLQQAYIQAVAPLAFFSGSEVFGDTIDIRVGRFVTLAGSEVIEGGSNWNISRNFGFGYAIPTTHTGLRTIYRLFNDRLTTYWGVNNGWDSLTDNNRYKTLESGFSFSPLESVTWTTSFYWGPETAQQSGHKRFLASNVATWNATDKLAFIGEFNIGNERRVPGLEGKTFENAQWHNYTGYARYQLTDKLAFAARFELFRDDDTYRFNATQAAGANNRTVWSPTLTAEYKFYENLLGRVEFRHDQSNANKPFNAEKNQNTLGAQMIYNFA